MEDRLIAQHIGGLGIDHEGDAAQRAAVALFLHGRVTADEIILRQVNEAVHLGLEAAIDGAKLAIPGGEVLLETHGEQGAHAEVDDAVLFSGLHDRIIEAALVFGPHPDLVTQIAGIGDAVDDDRAVGNVHFAHIHEAEGGIGDILIGQRCQDITGFRPGDRQTDKAHIETLDHDGAIIGQMLLEPAHVIFLRLA